MESLQQTGDPPVVPDEKVSVVPSVPAPNPNRETRTSGPYVAVAPAIAPAGLSGIAPGGLSVTATNLRPNQDIEDQIAYGDAVSAADRSYAAGLSGTLPHLRQTADVMAANGFSGTVTEPTTFVVGENGPENVQVNPLTQSGDQPFLDRIRAIRTGISNPAPVPGGGFNVGFQNVLPSLRERFIKGQQSRFGVPIADQLAEINRFRLPTIDRNQVNFSI